MNAGASLEWAHNDRAFTSELLKFVLIEFFPPSHANSICDFNNRQLIASF